MEEKKGLKDRIAKEIKDHRWLCIMCCAALLLIITVLSIPVNNGESVLSSIIKNKEIKLRKSDFSIISVDKKGQGNYIDNNEEFIVKTKDGSLEDVKTHLLIDPPLNYEIEEQSKDEYILKLRDVPRDTIVNVNYVVDEVADNKWAFQSNKDFKVTSIYPKDGSTYVSNETIIEIVFSSAYNGDISKYFSIEPKVEGTFETIGRVVRFKPNKPLEYDTKYTIHVEKGMESNGLVMEEGYTSTFSTHRDYNSSDHPKYSSITIDNINTFKVGEPPIFRIYNSIDIKDNPISKITISKFKNINNFMNYINNEKEYSVDELGEYAFTTNDLYKNCIILEKGLEKGYYLENVYLNNGELYTSIPVQVSDLSAYAFTSDRDLLVWVGSNNKLLKDINISYKDKKFKTDEDGVGILKNYNKKDEKVDYVFVGDKDPLVIGVDNNDYSVYPNSYLYTDRPLYKNTDTVKVWGFIPLSYFEDEFNKEDLVLKLEDKPIDFHVDSKGIISAVIKLDNYQDNYYSLKLMYKNYYLAGRHIEVMNYQNQLYDYKTIVDKNYVYAGENFDFDVQVEHVSGMKVANKDVIAVYKEKEYRGITDGSGIVHFSIPTIRDNSDSVNVSQESIAIKNSDVLYNDYTDYLNFYKIDRLIDVDLNMLSKISSKKIKGKIRNIESNSKESNISLKGYKMVIDNLISDNYNGEVEIDIIERDYMSTQVGTRYNEFTKENQPVYNYSNVENIIKTDKIMVTDGVLDYKADFEEKKSDENNSYSYTYVVRVKDMNGIIYTVQGWFSNTEYYESEYVKGHTNYHITNYGESSGDYVVFRYYLDDQKQESIYSVDDKMNFILKNYQNEIINEKAKVLEIKYKTKIVETKLYDDTSDVTNIFNKEDEPGVDITGAYYVDDKFYRLPGDYYDYKQEDSNVDITIKPNKKSYKPREEVEVDIDTKDYKGEKLPTSLNISVVDESVFNIAEDDTSILETLNNDNYYHGYLYSSYRDYELYNEGGGAGATGGPDRYDFGDTIYFNNVATDNNGHAKIKFFLNDSITSFRITVHAANENNQVGSSHKLIQSKLPLSISYTEPRGVKKNDDLVLNANILGNENSKVTFEIEGKGKKEVDAIPGKTIYANFGKLEVGTYNVNIKAKSNNYSDSVKFKVSVIETQEETSIKTTKNVKDLKELKIKRNPISIELYREGFSKYLEYLDKMNNYERRLDTILSSRQSLYYQNKYYGTNNSLLDENLNEFKDFGFLRYLPNEETSPILTALVNYYTPGIFEIKKSDVYDRLNNNYVTKDYNKVIEYYLILASMKEPVLDDLNVFAKNISYGDDEHKALLILAYAFLGDYNAAKELYESNKLEIDLGLGAIISTFINKSEASSKIDEVLDKDKANRYLYFAMMSYFMNNNAKLSEKEEVTVSYGKTNKTIELQGIKIVELDISEKDLKSLKFNTEYDDILVNYYYQGELDKNNENVLDNIKISLNKNVYKVGEYAKLRINKEEVKDNNGYIKVYLPNGLRLSGNLGEDAWVVSNRIDYLIIYSKKNIIDIPLYVSSIGNYKINPVVIKVNDNYYISNELEVNIEE